MNKLIDYLKIPGEDLIKPIIELSNAMAKRGGNLREIWVSRQIYDQLTIEISDFERTMEKLGEQRNRWTNGLIEITTQTGRIKVRLDE